MSAPKLDLNAVANPIVKPAIEAINRRNKKQWYKSFSDKPEFTDDGNPQDFIEWCEKERFGSSLSYLASIDKVEDGGLMLTD
jgi:hypothetical protein